MGGWLGHGSTQQLLVRKQASDHFEAVWEIKGRCGHHVAGASRIAPPGMWGCRYG